MFEAPQRNTSISTCRVPLSEAIFDAIDLVHHHQHLQFKVSSESVSSDDADGEEASAFAISKYDQKCSEVRKTYIKGKLFPELYDLR